MERSLSEAHKKTPQKIAVDRAAFVVTFVVTFVGLVFQIQQNTDDRFDIKIEGSVSEAKKNKTKITQLIELLVHLGADVNLKNNQVCCSVLP